MKQFHLENTVNIHTKLYNKNDKHINLSTQHTSITSNSTLITPLITTLINAAYNTMCM